MNILMLCGEIPYPPHGGSRMRVFQFIRALAERHTLTLLAYQYGEDECAHIRALAPFCAVESVPWSEPAALARLRTGSDLAARLAHARALWLDPDPFVAQYFRLPAMAVRLRQLLARGRFDVLHVEDSAMMALLPAGVRIPVVLSLQNVEHWREARAARHGLTERIELGRLRRYERRAFGRAAVCCPSSALEAAQVCALHPKATVRVIANGVDTCAFAPGGAKAAEPTVVFSGTLSYAPNADGILWFAREIWPIIAQSVPAACLQIVGREPPPAIGQLASERILVAGDVPEVQPYLQRAWVAVAPIRDGGGTRLKILEALACGLPVVSTALGAEGLGVTPERDILIADDAPAFGGQLVRVLRDAALRAALGRAGRALVEREYDWSGITSQLEQVYLAACA